MSARPAIGITMGDPAGIGPEIIVKAFEDPELSGLCRSVVLGDPGALAPYTEKTALRLRETEGPGPGDAGWLDTMALSRLERRDLIPGRPTVAGGEAMVRYIMTAVEMALKGDLDAVVTGPISKDLMHRAGYPFGGHTRFLAHLTGVREPVMMLAGARLRVSLVTVHCPLREVADRLSLDRIHRTIEITAWSLGTDFGLKAPRVAVAALNPHAGESGLFGTEEEDLIRPAVRRAQHQGIRVEGPLPADTLFYRATSGEFDAVVAMYHDQGLGPLKLLHFSDAVNVTLGLPIVRTSVDHGTAYDIAGKGLADPSSLKAAVRMGVEIAENRRARAKANPTTT